MSNQEDKEVSTLVLDYEISSESPPSIKVPPSSTPKTEEDYFSGIVPGVLYAAGNGGIVRYTPKSCWNGGGCRTSCILYNENGECDYKTSMLKGTLPPTDKYRDIDNELLFKNESSLNHPKVDKPGEILVVVEDALEEERAESCIPLRISPLPQSIEEQIDQELRKYES